MGEIEYEISHVVLEHEKMTSRALFPRNPSDPATVVIGHHLPLATRAREKGGSSADQNNKYNLSHIYWYMHIEHILYTVYILDTLVVILT